MSAAAGNKSGSASAVYTITLLILCYILSNFDRQIVSVLANDIKADFGLSDTEIGALQGFTFTACYAVAGIPMARLIDGLSRVRLAAAFVGIWSVMTTLCGVAQNFTQLLIYRAGTAFSEAGLPTASLSIFADLLGKRKLAWVSALLMTAPYMGGGLALLAGGWLLDRARSIIASGSLPIHDVSTWHLVFLAAGLPGISLALLMLLTLREPTRRQIASGDVASEPAPSTRAILRLLSGQRAFWFPFMVVVPAMVLTLFAQMAWIPPLLMRSYALSPSSAGLLAGPVVLVLGVCGSLVSGLLISRSADAKMVSFCVSLMAKVIYLAAPLTLLYFVPGSLAAAITAYAAQIVLLAVFTATWPLTVQLLVPNRARARTIAIINLAGAMIGQGMGPFAVGVINDRFLSGAHLQLAIGFTVTLGVAIAVVAITFAWRNVAELELRHGLDRDG